MLKADARVPRTQLVVALPAILDLAHRRRLLRRHQVGHQPDRRVVRQLLRRARRHARLHRDAHVVAVVAQRAVLRAHRVERLQPLDDRLLVLLRLDLVKVQVEVGRLDEVAGSERRLGLLQDLVVRDLVVVAGPALQRLAERTVHGV